MILHHPISAIPWETTYSKSQHAQKQWFLLCSNHDSLSWLEPYKNNGFLTSRQGIGVPNAGWLKPPAERHRGNAIFGSYQLWIEFWACAGSWAESLGCRGSPWNMCKMLLAIVQKIAEIGWYICPIDTTRKYNHHPCEVVAPKSGLAAGRKLVIPLSTHCFDFFNALPFQNKC